jgi:molecular chaperone GrpE
MMEDVRNAVSGDGNGEGVTAPGTGGDPAPAPEDGAAPPAEELVAEPSLSDTVESFAAGTAAGEALPVAEVVDYKDRWLRSEAEMQNVRRRAARDREEAVTRAQEQVLLDALAVLDDLDRALGAMAPEQAGEPWAQGVALTAQHMRDALARWDVREIDAVGRPFDPTVHEALLEIEAPEGIAPGAVAQVVLKGYRRGERALRAARVVVARATGRG